jgi:hypothetical protein
VGPSARELHLKTAHHSLFLAAIRYVTVSLLDLAGNEPATIDAADIGSTIAAIRAATRIELAGRRSIAFDEAAANRAAHRAARSESMLTRSSNLIPSRSTFHLRFKFQLEFCSDDRFTSGTMLIFFYSHVVFFLTSMFHESIHFSSAVSKLQNRCNPSKRENRQMATKKAAKKAPAKKAVKKAAKKK